jgi:hypothetical protein
MKLSESIKEKNGETKRDQPALTYDDCVKSPFVYAIA